MIYNYVIPSVRRDKTQFIMMMSLMVFKRLGWKTIAQVHLQRMGRTTVLLQVLINGL